MPIKQHAGSALQYRMQVSWTCSQSVFSTLSILSHGKFNLIAKYNFFLPEHAAKSLSGTLLSLSISLLWFSLWQFRSRGSSFVIISARSCRSFGGKLPAGIYPNRAMVIDASFARQFVKLLYRDFRPRGSFNIPCPFPFTSHHFFPSIGPRMFGDDLIMTCIWSWF